jgi:hypothetical protein
VETRGEPFPEITLVSITTPDNQRLDSVKGCIRRAPSSSRMVKKSGYPFLQVVTRPPFLTLELAFRHTIVHTPSRCEQS